MLNVEYYERHCNFEKGHFQILYRVHFPSTINIEGYFLLSWKDITQNYVYLS